MLTGVFPPVKGEEHLCQCEACFHKRHKDNADPFFMSRMILCAICGNKRCPHATDHRNPCTDSNDLGQPGSSYA